IERAVVVLQCLAVLAVDRTDAADRGDAKADGVAVPGGVTLEIALQPALPLRKGKVVVNFGEMVHADVFVAGVLQAPDRQQQQLQFFLRGRSGACRMPATNTRSEE